MSSTDTPHPISNQRSIRKFISLYSKQKNDETGVGRYSVNLNANDPNLAETIEKLKADQRTANEEYTRKKLDGEIIPQKYHRRKVVIATPELLDTIRNNVNVPNNTPMQAPNHFQKTKFKLLLDEGTGNTTFLLGSSKMGKSTALMKIYDKYYSGEKKMISILWTCNPQIKLYKKHKNLLVAGCWNQHGEDIIKSQKKIQTATKNHYEFLNMFDDVISVRNNVLLENLILTYRNSKMSSIISLQYSNLLSKCSRANCNNVLAFGFNTDESIEVVIKTFLLGYLKSKGITSLPDMINWYKAMTKDHSFIYIKPADGIVSFHKFENVTK